MKRGINSRRSGLRSASWAFALAVVMGAVPRGVAQCEQWESMDRGMHSYAWATSFVEYDGRLIVGGEFSEADGEDALGLASWDGLRLEPFPSRVGADLGGYVRAMAVFRGDLIIGGMFSEVDGVPAANIARWDGRHWHALGSGADREVRALFVYGDQLLVGGEFTTAGGIESPGIARWDGSQWHNFGGGLSGGYGWNPAAYAFVEYRGELIVGGAFDHAGAVEAINAARWDGANWHPLDTGIDGLWINAFCVYDGDLIAGGVFGFASGRWVARVARWNGSEWSPLGKGVGDNDGEVYALHVLGDDLYAAGQFDSSGPTELSNIARWVPQSEQWLPVGKGANSRVNAMTFYNGELIVGGLFTQAGGLAANSLARWDSRSWKPLAGGVRRPGWVGAMIEYRGHILAGGYFAPLHQEEFPSLAWWDGARWRGVTGRSFAKSAGVYSLAVYRGELIVGGITNFHGEGLPQHHIARWDGRQWHSMGEELSGDPLVMLVHDDQLIVGGNFFYVGDKQVNFIAAWDGREWHSIGNGLDGSVMALAVYDGELIAGGGFYRSGDGEVVNYLAAWNGERWRSLGGGVRGGVHALTLYRGDLIVGGKFSSAGGEQVNNIARWDGQQWHPLGEGANWSVRALAVYNGDLIASGLFTTADGRPARRIARWDGEQWRPMSKGLANGGGSSLLVSGGRLLVGGGFVEADGRTVNSIAQWRDCNLSIQLDITATCPGGGPVEASWTDATPDGNVAIIFATGTGNFAVPYGPCAGTRLGLGSQGIRLAATARSDAQGAGAIRGTAPPAACAAYLQLLDLAACETSNVARIE